MNKYGNKAQTWSIDLAIAVVLFLLVASVFYIILTKKDTNNLGELQRSSESLANKMFQENSGIDIVKEGKVEQDRVENLLSRNYEDVKKEIGTEEEFCIVMKDENGNIIPFKDKDGNQYLGIGPANDELNFSDKKCGTKIK